MSNEEKNIYFPNICAKSPSLTKVRVICKEIEAKEISLTVCERFKQKIPCKKLKRSRHFNSSSVENVLKKYFHCCLVIPSKGQGKNIRNKKNFVKSKATY